MELSPRSPAQVLRGRFCEIVGGNFHAASARWLDSVESVLLAEVEALRDGVRFIQEGTRERVIVETDSQELVSLWNNRRKYRSEITAIMDAVEEMASNFTSFQVIHARRSANFAAHLCA
jgi:hypothetical protein